MEEQKGLHRAENMPRNPPRASLPGTGAQVGLVLLFASVHYCVVSLHQESAYIVALTGKFFAWPYFLKFYQLKIDPHHC